MLGHLADVSIRSLALALIASAVLWRRRSAAVQHAVWTALVSGMLGLFVLGSALPRLPIPVLHSEPVQVAPPTAYLNYAVRPIANPRAAVPRAVAVTPRRSIDWGEIAVRAWAVISFAFLLRFAAGMLLVRRLLASSVSIEGFRESERIAVPLTVGWFRPQILLPVEWRKWDRAKLDAVLAHEGAHVRRRDNLIAALAAMNRCIFWFHPLAWWLERRLGPLAELACDEECVAMLGDRERYASLLIEMASAVDAAHGRLRQHALTMAASSHIGQRIEAILEEGRSFSRGMGRAGWAAIVVCGIPLVLGAGTLTLDRQIPLPPLLWLGQPQFVPYGRPAPPPPPPPPRARFRDVSIQPAPPPPPPGEVGCGASHGPELADRGCMSLRMLLLEVFNIPSSRLVTPDWANTPRFNIYAKLPEGATEDQVPGMFLSLLEERFGLTYHVEVRDGPVLALVAAQGGMKMKPATSDSELPAWVATAASEPYRDRNMRGVRFRSMAAPGSDGNAEILQSPSMGWVRKSALVPPDYGVVYYQAPSISMEGLAALATIADDGLDAVVVDRTGLRGRYQVNLGISLGDLAAYFLDALRGLAAPQDPQLKVVQSGLKQLGLELQPARAPLETFVVDHLEKTPMGN